MNEVINIGSRRECLWDDYLIAKSDASFRVHEMRKTDIVMRFDAPWEGDGCNYFIIIPDEGLYRMYYLAWKMLNPEKNTHTMNDIRICYAESIDGIKWKKPSLGFREFEGSYDNNILFDRSDYNFDNFAVMLDTNPNCPTSERYKAVFANNSSLDCMTSSDGIHFSYGWQLTDKGAFDSVNIALWSEEYQEYFLFLRDFHNKEIPPGIRDIRFSHSSDFKNWSSPVRLDFGEGEDYQLYTNQISKYYRAPHQLIGFPSRYVERKSWNTSFEELCGKENRLTRIAIHPRYGLTTTDCVFMTSRNGRKWKRYDEAIIRPGPETPTGWVYGDCYPALGMIETRSIFPGDDNVLSLYCNANHWSGLPALLYRLEQRIDGFVSLHADYSKASITTKPFSFVGNSLYINFSTSARGYIKIVLSTVDGKYICESDDLFGDSINRRVGFARGKLAELSEKPVTMNIEMSDSDLFSFIFR